jgi:hypothetical protein
MWFDLIGIDYIYEMEGYVLQTVGAYLPDFYVPNMKLRTTVKHSSGTYIEVKPDEPDFDSVEMRRLHELCEMIKCDCLMVWGLPKADGGYIEVSLDCDLAVTDEPMSFCKCHKCGRIKIEFDEGNYFYCNHCKRRNDKIEFCDPDHPIFESASNYVRSYRFWNGKNG